MSDTKDSYGSDGGCDSDSCEPTSKSLKRRKLQQADVVQAPPTPMPLLVLPSPSIPDEIIDRIFEFVHLTTLVQCRQVNNQFHRMFEDELLHRMEHNGVVPSRQSDGGGNNDSNGGNTPASENEIEPKDKDKEEKKVSTLICKLDFERSDLYECQFELRCFDAEEYEEEEDETDDDDAEDEETEFDYQDDILTRSPWSKEYQTYSEFRDHLIEKYCDPNGIYSVVDTLSERFGYQFNPQRCKELFNRSHGMVAMQYLRDGRSKVHESSGFINSKPFCINLGGGVYDNLEENARQLRTEWKTLQGNADTAHDWMVRYRAGLRNYLSNAGHDWATCHPVEVFSQWLGEFCDDVIDMELNEGEDDSRFADIVQHCSRPTTAKQSPAVAASHSVPSSKSPPSVEVVNNYEYDHHHQQQQQQHFFKYKSIQDELNAFKYCVFYILRDKKKVSVYDDLPIYKVDYGYRTPHKLRGSELCMKYRLSFENYYCDDDSDTDDEEEDDSTDTGITNNSDPKALQEEKKKDDEDNNSDNDRFKLFNLELIMKRTAKIGHGCL